jgi:hypothetical protein
MSRFSDVVAWAATAVLALPVELFSRLFEVEVVVVMD